MSAIMEEYVTLFIFGGMVAILGDWFEKVNGKLSDTENQRVLEQSRISQIPTGKVYPLTSENNHYTSGRLSRSSETNARRASILDQNHSLYHPFGEYLRPDSDKMKNVLSELVMIDSSLSEMAILVNSAFSVQITCLVTLFFISIVFIAHNLIGGLLDYESGGYAAMTFDFQLLVWLLLSILGLLYMVASCKSTCSKIVIWVFIFGVTYSVSFGTSTPEMSLDVYVLGVFSSDLIIFLMECQYVSLVYIACHYFEDLNSQILGMGRNYKRINLGLVKKSWSILPDQAVSPGPTPMECSAQNKLRNVTRLHDVLCDLVHLVNSTFSIRMLSDVASIFVHITTHLYCALLIICDLVHVEEVASLSLVSHIICIVFYSLKVLWILKACILTVYELQMFSMQLLHRKVQFTACGFFPLDYTLLYSCFSGVMLATVSCAGAGDAVEQHDLPLSQSSRVGPFVLIQTNWEVCDPHGVRSLSVERGERRGLGDDGGETGGERRGLGDDGGETGGERRGLGDDGGETGERRGLGDVGGETGGERRGLGDGGGETGGVREDWVMVEGRKQEMERLMFQTDPTSGWELIMMVRMTLYRSKQVLLESGLQTAGILVGQDGKIDRILTGELLNSCDELEVVDVDDLVIMAGVVDSHVHVNEPGRTDWEGYWSATRAAAAGGVTTIVDMPLYVQNSIPSTTTVSNLQTKLKAAQGQTHVDVAFWGGVIPGNQVDLESVSLLQDELRGLVDAGVVGFKCFLCPSGVDEFPHVSLSDVETALHQLQGTSSPLAFHAECDLDLEDKERSDDPCQYQTFLNSRPPAMEVEAIRIVTQLCLKYRWHHCLFDPNGDKCVSRDGTTVSLIQTETSVCREMAPLSLWSKRRQMCIERWYHCLFDPNGDKCVSRDGTTVSLVQTETNVCREMAPLSLWSKWRQMCVERWHHCLFDPNGDKCVSRCHHCIIVQLISTLSALSEVFGTGEPNISNQCACAFDNTCALQPEERRQLRWPFVRCHIVHLSAAEALPLVHAAKQQGALLTAETCHHYLTLAAEEVPNCATQYKCCPPVRGQPNRCIRVCVERERVKKYFGKTTLSTADRDSNLDLPVIGSLVYYESSALDHVATEAGALASWESESPLADTHPARRRCTVCCVLQELLWKALYEGDLDMVVSDHSPCTPDLKKLEQGDFLSAWGGISSLQFGTVISLDEI
uniref:Allantoinase n=1 Tax=Timema genevievae TaxID=629358 RepID=A0A7R9JV56_TIMGE|nr:unnamed protein product [Timema genevievae]